MNRREIETLVRDVTNELAQTLLKVATAQQEPVAVPVLSEIQQRAELGYRLIRNGLGNLGGRGDVFGDRALLRMSQRVQGVFAKSLRIEDLPKRARYVDLHWHDKKNQRYEQRIPGPHSGGTQEIRIDGEPGIRTLDLVEVLDGSHRPIASGVPVVFVDATTGCEE